MTLAKHAYMAGILDGEGHFSIVFHEAENRHHLIVGVMNTDAKLMEWLKANYGGHVYHRKSPSQKSHWKDRYEWRMEPIKAPQILKQVLPFLVIKAEQARVVLEFRQTFTEGKRMRKADKLSVLPVRSALHARLKELNS